MVGKFGQPENRNVHDMMLSLYLLCCHYGQFYVKKGTIMNRSMVDKVPLWPVLWLVSYHYGQFYGW